MRVWIEEERREGLISYFKYNRSCSIIFESWRIIMSFIFVDGLSLSFALIDATNMQLVFDHMRVGIF